MSAFVSVHGRRFVGHEQMMVSLTRNDYEALAGFEIPVRAIFDGEEALRILPGIMHASPEKAT